MEKTIAQHIGNLSNRNKEVQGNSFRFLTDQTREQVDWAYEVWDHLLDLLKSDDNRARAIAGQLLSSLAKSDPEGRMKIDFKELLEGTKDERFVTARHILQSLWKVGIVNKELQEITVSGLRKRYENCANHKNSTLIRYDIIILFRKMYDETEDNSLKETAFTLIEQEPDEKYRKKYLKEWKDLLK